MKKKILISITSQFGYHTDTYMYCKYLDKNKYELHYVGFDVGQTRIALNEINIHYIQVYRNKIKRYLFYIHSINKLLRYKKFDLLFIIDCQASLLIRLFNLNCNAILDIRTGNVSNTLKYFQWYNWKIYLSSLFYKQVTIVSESLRKRLNLPQKKCHILPLGGEPFPSNFKDFQNIKLLYIGTLNGRNIHQTIEGVAIFLQNQDKQISIEYHIIGFGNQAVEQELKDLISQKKLENLVFFHGKKYHQELLPFLNECNVGVIYVPITRGYTCQPTTKLYECGLAGMALIATATKENRKAITEKEGVLIKDSPASFAEGLNHLYKNRHSYNAGHIQQKYQSYTWQAIVQKNLEPYLSKLLCI